MAYKSNVLGTYCSDPEASHTVSGVLKTPGMEGAGIFGYYINEFDAHRAARHLREAGGFNVTVDLYNPFEKVVPGIHPLVEKFM